MTPTVEVTGNATATTTGIGTGTVTATALHVVTTGTVVTGTRIGTGVTEGAPVAIRLIAGREEATPLVARGAQDVLVNVTVTVINPKFLVVVLR